MKGAIKRIFIRNGIFALDTPLTLEINQDGEVISEPICPKILGFGNIARIKLFGTLKSERSSLDCRDLGANAQLRDERGNAAEAVFKVISN